MKRIDTNKIYELYTEIQDDEELKLIKLSSIGNEVFGTYIGSKSYLDMMARIWDENIHFYEGDHYLYYNDILGQYGSRPVTKFNRFIPRSITNYIFPITGTMCSIMTKNKPAVQVTPNSTKEEDENRAKLADTLLDAKWDIDHETFNYIMAIKLAILTGTVYRKDYWDVSTLAEVVVPGDTKTLNAKAVKAGIKKERESNDDLNDKQLRKLVIEKLKKDENAYGLFSKKKKDKTESDVKITVEDSDLTYQEDAIHIPLGDNKVNILSVFEIIPDIQCAIKNLDDGEFIMEATLHPTEWIKRTYDQDKPGYTGLAKDVEEDKELALQLIYFERMKGSTGKSGQYGVQPDLTNQAVLIECYLKPTKDYPKGMMIVVCNQKVLYINSSPYTLENGENWHPYTMFRWELHPLRHHGISLTEQQVPIQKKINAINNLIILNRMTMANGIWLVPIGCLTPGGYISGEPGLNVPYKPGVGKPERILGIPLDASVYKEKDAAIVDLHTIAGDNEVLQGLRPEGVSTASGLNMLMEQSFSKFSPIIQNWEKFIEEGQTKKINLVRRFYKEPRPELIKRMKQLNKDLLTVEIDDFFTGEDLGNNIDVRVEAGSSLPRSQAVHQSNVKELAQLPQNVLGVLDPIQNPEGNKAFLEIFGISDFPTMTGKDTDRAKWENNLLRQKKFKDVEVLAFDNPVIHFNIVTEEMKRKEFWQVVEPDVIAQYVIHAIHHYLDMTPQQAQLAGLSPAQEKQILSMGLKLLPKMNKLQQQELQQKAIALGVIPNPQPPMQPQGPMGPQGVPAGPQGPAANFSPAGMPPQGGNPSPTSSGATLNPQGGNI